MSDTLTTKPEPLTLDLAGAGRLLGVSPWTVKRWAKAGKLPRMEGESRYRFLRGELERWAQGQPKEDDEQRTNLRQ